MQNLSREADFILATMLTCPVPKPGEIFHIVS